MQQVLVYSDSLSWGIIPETRVRLPFEKRWPGVLEHALIKEGQNVRVIENCLNGRRTVWSDPFKNGRNGAEGLSEAIEINSPLRLVILMLGTNDFQDTHDNNAWLSAQGMAKLVGIIRQSPIEPGMPVPEILIISPPVIVEPKGYIANKFKNAEKRCVGLPGELEKVARGLSTQYLDGSQIIKASTVDGIHLDESQHNVLGKAVAQHALDSSLF